MIIKLIVLLSNKQIIWFILQLWFWPPKCLSESSDDILEAKILFLDICAKSYQHFSCSVEKSTFVILSKELKAQSLCPEVIGRVNAIWRRTKLFSKAILQRHSKISSLLWKPLGVL